MVRKLACLSLAVRSSCYKTVIFPIRKVDKALKLARALLVPYLHRLPWASHERATQRKVLYRALDQALLLQTSSGLKKQEHCRRRRRRCVGCLSMAVPPAEEFHDLFPLVLCLALAVWLGHVVHCRRWVGRERCVGMHSKRQR